jgi:hypothetical protein
MTTRKKIIVVPVPGSGVLGRYEALVVGGVICLKPTTTKDLDQIPNYEVPADSSALDLLLAERDADSR